MMTITRCRQIGLSVSGHWRPVNGIQQTEQLFLTISLDKIIYMMVIFIAIRSIDLLKLSFDQKTGRIRYKTWLIKGGYHVPVTLRESSVPLPASYLAP